MTMLKNATVERTAGPERVLADLLDVNAVAAMLDCSPRTVFRLADSEQLPRPVRLGALVRWRAAELREWIGGGCQSVGRRGEEVPDGD